MKTLDAAISLYKHYDEVDEIIHYYGLLALYGLTQAVYEKRSEEDIEFCREELMKYPAHIHHPRYNFECYRIGGNASAWAAMKGVLSRPKELLAEYADRTMAAPKDRNGVMCMPAHPEYEQIWIDTAAAVTPFMLFMGITCDRADYIDFAARQCFGMVEPLMDPSCGLLHQARGFIDGDRSKISQDHWSRGNGWGYLALAELVQYLPRDSAHKEKAERYFKELSAAFLPYQNERGLWRQELTRKDAWEESSGTALILYGMGIGLRLGLLDQATFAAPYRKGLEGLIQYCIHDDFSTEHSCQGCLCPGSGEDKGTVHAYLTAVQSYRDEHHSFGSFMLALVEAHRNGLTDLDWKARRFV